MVSIQLLLLFYVIRIDFSYQFISFQYNFCYCSISNWNTVMNRMNSFNTTFVTVLCKRRYRFFSCISVSIQLLLLFYKNLLTTSPMVNSFQYNFCYCSIESRVKASVDYIGFNTTFVTVLCYRRQERL